MHILVEELSASIATTSLGRSYRSNRDNTSQTCISSDLIGILTFLPLWCLALRELTICDIGERVWLLFHVTLQLICITCSKDDLIRWQIIAPPNISVLKSSVIQKFRSQIISLWYRTIKRLKYCKLASNQITADDPFNKIIIYILAAFSFLARLTSHMHIDNDDLYLTIIHQFCIKLMIICVSFCKYMY